ncbi:unnamed protein product [Rotaria sordida]|uniref:Uncharacterized protein n=1 Tax=Rotaria sordida TaxID=392033 RepID=A0A819HKW0_9BILA|nr:unnamed protein product [Rotaria sordida]CAF1104852.1 unnamed protein product [Rotaria sordida]CAF1151096.1 unnamed protein product [Rotaria sordida]CAF1389994.1 unnamed protein product [Rotaria sordida]CAF3901755.1 unnamed protein product [Rotaria sordida]
MNQAFAHINQELKDTFTLQNTTDNHSSGTTELERKNSLVNVKKPMKFERQLKRQRKIEEHKEEERKKLYEQRETARKEMKQKSCLEWERQCMQESIT